MVFDSQGIYIYFSPRFCTARSDSIAPSCCAPVEFWGLQSTWIVGRAVSRADVAEPEGLSIALWPPRSMAAMSSSTRPFRPPGVRSLRLGAVATDLRRDVDRSEKGRKDPPPALGVKGGVRIGRNQRKLDSGRLRNEVYLNPESQSNYCRIRNI